MARRHYTNLSPTMTLTAAVDNDDVVLPVTSTAGTPAVPFTACIERGEEGQEEAVLVTGKTSNSLTVTRGWDETSAVGHEINKPVEHVVTALDYEEANAHIEDISRDDHTQYLDETRHDALDHSAVVAGLVVPIGGLVPYAGTTEPNSSFKFANGQAISRTTYAACFGVLGTIYGVGDNATTFNLPDLRGRFPLGQDDMGTSAAGRVTIEDASAPGLTGGAQQVVLTSAQMPTHTHVQNAHTHVQNAHTHTGATNVDQHRHAAANGGQFVLYGGTGEAATMSLGSTHSATTYTAYDEHQHTLQVNSTVAVNQNATATNQNTGGGQAHPNLPPFLVINWLIRVQ